MEGLRAYAALLVFLVHYFDAYGRNILGVDLNTLHLGEAPDIITEIVLFLFASHYGVDIFFFLSGFLIYRIITRSQFSFLNFARGRLLRIYPTFLVSFLVWLYIRIVLQSYPFEISQFAGNLLFLNAVPALGVQPYNAVTWSLFYEFVFYLTFPAILLLRSRSGRTGPLQILLFCLAFMIVASNMGPSFIRFLMFFGGALMACIQKERLVTFASRLPDTAVLAFYFTSTLLFARLLSYTYFIPVFLVTTFLLVLKVLYGTGFLNRIFRTRWLRYMGNISFSFYLMHGLAIELVMVHFTNIFSGLNGVFFFVTTFGFALVLGIGLATGLFLLTEKPYFTRRQRHYPQRQEAEATV